MARTVVYSAQALKTFRGLVTLIDSPVTENRFAKQNIFEDLQRYRFSKNVAKNIHCPVAYSWN